MSALDDLNKELLAARAVLLPEIQGLLDLLKLNIQPNSAVEVASIYEGFERRRHLLERAFGALNDLSNNGYPALPPHEVSQAVLVDLKQNLSAIKSAILQVTPEAISVTITPGTPTEKP